MAHCTKFGPICNTEIVLHKAFVSGTRIPRSIDFLWGRLQNACGLYHQVRGVLIKVTNFILRTLLLAIYTSECECFQKGQSYITLWWPRRHIYVKWKHYHNFATILMFITYLNSTLFFYQINHETFIVKLIHLLGDI